MTEYEQVERDITHYKAQVAVGAALERLSSNKDFKQIIGQGYFKDEAVRLVSLTASAGINEQALIRQMAGIANLEDYLRQIRKTAEIAAKSLPDSESTLEFLAKQGGNL